MIPFDISLRNKMVLIVFLGLLVFPMSAFSLRDQSFSVCVTQENTTVYETTCEMPLGMYLKFFFRYGRSYKKMIKNEYLGDIKSFFGSTNSRIYDNFKLNAEARTISPVDASCRYLGNGTFSYEKERSGKKIDVEKTLFLAAENEFAPTEAVTQTLFPTLYEEDIRGATVKISTFSTQYGFSAPGRRHNVELAASFLDGLKIGSGEMLSFNQAVGKRTEENGFKTAKVIVNGVYTDGLGGGVCQVSGTLMNAWIRAGAEVVFSQNHSLPASYLPAGLDATVSDRIDLLLKNNSSFPIYIDSYCDGQTLMFTLYGKPCGYQVETVTELAREIVCNEYDVEAGEETKIVCEPKNGKIYKTFILLKQNGKLVEKKFFRTSSYLPEKGKKIIKSEDKSFSNGTQ